MGYDATVQYWNVVMKSKYVDVYYYPAKPLLHFLCKLFSPDISFSDVVTRREIMEAKRR